MHSRHSESHAGGTFEMNFLRSLFGGGRREKEEPRTGPEFDKLDAQPVPLVGGQTRPLPPIEEVPVSSNKLRYGQATDPGMVRSHNEDALLTLSGTIESMSSEPPFGIFVVADGMGGHSEGERASLLAAKTLTRHVTNHVYLPMLVEQERNADQLTIPEVLEEAMHLADREV